MKNPILSELKPVEGMDNVYSAVFRYRNQDLVAHIDPENKELRVILNAAENAVKELERIETLALNAACAELLDTYNKNWREYDESDGHGGSYTVSNPVLTAKEFKERLTLDHIHVLAEDELTLSFNDDDLFLGHSIDVRSLDGLAFTELDVGISG